jgi:hypothetical protein
MTDKILSFSDWERANKVYEDVHSKVFAALRSAPTKLHQGVSNAKNELGDESGLTGFGAQGSSRGVYHTTKGHEIELDGKKTKVNTILKTTLQRKSSVPGKQTGQRQNEVEASNHIQKFATIVRDGKGGYKTNPDGVIPPVYEIGKKSKWLHSGTARDLEPGEFRELTKHDSHPDGIESYHLSSWTSHGSGEDHEHPIVRKFAKFRKETGIGDFHDGNFGVWEHPHTGERHLVLRDAGFDNSVKKDYGFHSSKGTVQTPVPVTKHAEEPKAERKPRGPAAPKVPQVGDQEALKLRIPKGGADKNKALQKNIKQNTIQKYDRHMIDQKAEKFPHTPNTIDRVNQQYDHKVGAYTYLAGLKKGLGKDPSSHDVRYAKADKNFQGDRRYNPNKQYVINAKKPEKAEENPDNKPSTAEYNQRRVDIAAEKFRINKRQEQRGQAFRVNTREVQYRMPIPKYKGK